MKDCQDYFALSIHLSNTTFWKLNGMLRTRNWNLFGNRHLTHTNMHSLTHSLTHTLLGYHHPLPEVPPGQEHGGISSLLPSLPSSSPPAQGDLPGRLKPSSRGRGRAGDRPAPSWWQGQRGCSSATGSRRLLPIRGQGQACETGIRPGFAPGLPPCRTPL